MIRQTESRSGLAECDTDATMIEAWESESECDEPSGESWQEGIHVMRALAPKCYESPVLREFGSAQSPEMAFRILNLELQQRELLQRVERLEYVPSPLLVPINTFAPKPFEAIGQILVLVESVLDESGEPCEYIGTFVDGSVSVTGDTVEEAVQLLKSRMITQYNLLTKLRPEQLGRIPQRQLAALKAVMRRTG